VHACMGMAWVVSVCQVSMSTGMTHGVLRGGVAVPMGICRMMGSVVVAGAASGTR
jgi:hypothetical protein